MEDSTKIGDFFSIRANAAERSSQLALHDQTCIQKEQAGVCALGQSLRSGISFDAVFLAFNRRLINGRVAEPQPIFANTSVLTARFASFGFDSPTATSLFAVRNSSTDSGSETQHEIQATIWEDYDYDSDSDLDEEEVLNCEVPQTTPVVDEPSANENTAQNNDVHVLDASDNSSLLSFNAIENAESESLGNTATTPMRTDETMRANAMCPLVERTVFVKGAAYRTWHALVFYCYTGQISFCDLRSQVGPGGPFSRPKHDDGSPPPCSPKSMYRLADKLGIEPLKALAFAAIEERLSQANILDESFSKFTSMYFNSSVCPWYFSYSRYLQGFQRS
ncbi:hypothetical protein F5I97DRAFT_726519 [Phlebopus sp. FC_14]|nr:hypothetical protein F5I97DRAFT_726519 [Phlebopus sp. FC_14]